MKRILILIIIMAAVCFVQAEQTIAERVEDYNQLKEANNQAYLDVINGVGADMMATAEAQVAEATAIREDAQAEIDADPDMDWATGREVMGIVDNHMTYQDTLIKAQMLQAFDQIIEIVRAEMNDEYADHGLAKRQQMVAIMQMLVMCVDQNYNGVPEQ